jgi:hypothetical protein
VVRFCRPLNGIASPVANGFGQYAVETGDELDSMVYHRYSSEDVLWPRGIENWTPYQGNRLLIKVETIVACTFSESNVGHIIVDLIFDMYIHQFNLFPVAVECSKLTRDISDILIKAQLGRIGMCICYIPYIDLHRVICRGVSPCVWGRAIWVLQIVFWPSTRRNLTKYYNKRLQLR